MIYIDHIHMTADSLSELHSFATLIGLKRHWFHAARKHPHYDIKPKYRLLAIQNGATIVSSKIIVEKSKKLLDKSN